MKQLNEEQLKSAVGGIVCQCGNPIIIDRVNDYWLSILKEREQELREEIEGIINPKLPEGFATTGNCIHGSLSGLCGNCAQDKLLQILALLSNKDEN